MDGFVYFVTDLLPKLFFVGLFAAIAAFFLRLIAEIGYAAVLAGIQMFPWASQRWGRQGVIVLAIGWILLAPVMVAICLVLGTFFGVIFVLRSKKTARELDDLYLRYLIRRDSTRRQAADSAMANRQ